MNTDLRHEDAASRAAFFVPASSVPLFLGTFVIANRFVILAVRISRHAGLAAHRPDLFAAHELAPWMRCRHFIGKVLTNVRVTHSGAVHGSRDSVLPTEPGEPGDFYTSLGMTPSR